MVEQKELSDIFQAIPLPSYIFKYQDNNFILDNFNARAFEVTSGRVEKYKYKPAVELYPDMPFLLDDIQSCYKDKLIKRRQVTYTSPTSGITVHLINTYAYVDPDKVSFYTVDITEIIDQENEIKNSEERIKNIFESISDGILIADIDGIIVDCNTVTGHFFDYNVDDIIGKHLVEILPIVNGLECNRDQIECWITGNIIFESTGLRSDGATILLELSSIMFHDANGEKISLFIRDITDRKNHEKAQAEIQQLSAINKMSITMAHEFNNPLAIIKGIMDLIEMENLDPKLKNDLLEKTHVQIERMTGLVTKFLNMNSITEIKYADNTDFYDIHGYNSDNKRIDS